MKKEQLSDAVSGIDGKFVEEYLDETAKKQSVAKRRIAIFSAVAALAVIITAAVIVGLSFANREVPPDKGSEAESDTSEELTQNVIRGENIPEWYAPGDLKLVTVATHKKDSASASKSSDFDYLFDNSGNSYTNYELLDNYNDFGEAETDIEIPVVPEYTFTTAYGKSDYYIVRGVGSRFLSVRTDNKSDEHLNCPGVYYDTVTGEIICLNHTLGQALGFVDDGQYYHAIDTRGEFGDKVFVQYHMSDTSKMSDEEYEQYKESGSWIDDLHVAVYDLANGKMQELPNEMVYAVINGYFKVYGNNVIFVKGYYGQNDNQHLGLSLATVGDEINIVELTSFGGLDALSNGGAQFSSDGKYVAFAASVNDFWKIKHIQLEKSAKIRILNLETLEYNDVEGRFIHFTLDGKYAVAETYNGTVLYDCSNGNQIDYLNANLSLSDIYEVKREHAKADGKYKASIINVFDGSEAQTFDNVDAYVAQNGYLYMFQSERGTVVCQRIGTNESFEIPVDAKFLAAFANIESGFYPISKLNISDDGREILLYFVPIDANTLVWYTDGSNVKSSLEDLPSQYWDCESRHEALLKSILQRDESMDWTVDCMQNGFGYSFPYDNFAPVVDLLYLEGTAECSPEVLSGLKPIYTISFMRDYNREYDGDSVKSTDCVMIKIYVKDKDVYLKVSGKGTFIIGDRDTAIAVFKDVEDMYLRNPE